MNDDDAYPNERWLTVRQKIASGSGYTITRSMIDQSVSAEVHNSSRTEPVLSTAMLATVVPGVGLIIYTLFPNLVSQNVWDIIFYLIALFIPIVTALFTRGKVWSPASVKEILDNAIEAADATRNK